MGKILSEARILIFLTLTIILIPNSKSAESQTFLEESHRTRRILVGNCKYSYSKSSIYSGCRECKYGYYKYMSFLGTYMCGACNSGCQFCEDEYVCKGCFKKYFPTNDGKCSKCPNNCDECPDSSSCHVCSETFYLSSTQCESCIANCKYCPDATTCTECQKGYYADKDTKLCRKCPEHCEECTAENNCTSCSFNWVSDGKGSCREKTVGEKFMFWGLIIGVALLVIGPIIWCCMKAIENQRNYNNNYRPMGNEMGGGGYQ